MKQLIKEQTIYALKCARDVMAEEKANWEGTCDVFDDAIESCETALKLLEDKKRIRSNE